MNEARIDKWMWAVRIFKTRTIAAEACKKGRISINGALAKAARTVKPGDVIQVRKPPVTYSFKVLQPIEKRDGQRKKTAGVWKNLQNRNFWMISTLNSILRKSKIRERL